MPTVYTKWLFLYIWAREREYLLRFGLLSLVAASERASERVHV